MINKGTRRGARPSGISVTAEILGILLFIMGILMLVSCFQLAHQMFSELARTSHVWVQTPVRPAKEPSPLQIGISAATVMLKMLLLFVMGYLSSLVASKGIQFFAAAASVPARPSSVGIGSPVQDLEE